MSDKFLDSYRVKLYKTKSGAIRISIGKEASEMLYARGVPMGYMRLTEEKQHIIITPL